MTIVRLDTLEVSGTLTTGESPSAIVSIGGGRFVTANTFSDSLSVINAATNSVETITGCPSVPVDSGLYRASIWPWLGVPKPAYSFMIAISSRWIRDPSALATRIVAHAGGAFVLASTDKLFVVDPASTSVTATRDMAVDDLSSDDGMLYALKSSTVETLDANLQVTNATTLSQPASAIAAGW